MSKMSSFELATEDGENTNKETELLMKPADADTKGDHNEGEIPEDTRSDARNLSSTEIFMAVKCVVSALFVLVDIGSDISLAHGYFQATKFFARLSEQEELYSEDFNIWNSIFVWKKYSVFGNPSKWSALRRKFSQELRENSPMDWMSFQFFYVSVLWILLGGTLQVYILLFIGARKKQRGFYLASDLPTGVRLVVYVTTPFLLSPAVVQLYMAYQYLTKSKSEDILQNSTFVSRLKAGEATLESIPQFFTNIYAMYLIRMNHPTSPITIVQKVSTVTNFVTIMLAIMEWIKTSPDTEFVYKAPDTEKPIHPWSSLAALFFWIGGALVATMTAVMYEPRRIFDSVTETTNFSMLPPLLVNLLNLVVIIIVVAVHRWRENTYWRFGRVLLHFVLVCASTYFVVMWMLHSSNVTRLVERRLHYLLGLHLIGLFFQLMLGVLILIRMRIAALIFQFPIKGLFCLLESICCCDSIQSKIKELQNGSAAGRLTDDKEDAAEKDESAPLIESSVDGHRENNTFGDIEESSNDQMSEEREVNAVKCEVLPPMEENVGDVEETADKHEEENTISEIAVNSNM